MQLKTQKRKRKMFLHIHACVKYTVSYKTMHLPFNEQLKGQRFLNTSSKI